MSPPNTITTQILILPDTHGRRFGTDWPRLLDKFDIVTHCGDITQEANLPEFEDTLDLLRAIDAPLELIVAGNHHITLDASSFRKHLRESGI